MKFNSAFLYLCLGAATVSPALSHAQVDLPLWLKPAWIKAKLINSPIKSSESDDLALGNVATVNDTAGPQTTKPQHKPTVTKAPVETAVPKINEKHLTPEELKELRKQLRQQR